MARYFFNIRSGGETIADSEGQEFASLEVARNEAVESARELLAEAVLLGEAIDHRHFEIADEEGKTLAVVAFREAVRPS